jgi:DNA-binding transcriptional LysR family regulator
MGLLDDTAIFTAIIQQGSFNAAAKQLNLSNGLISRRLAQLEARLGVSLIKRTTRQMRLTPDGEIFFQHTQKIQQELESAILLMQTSANKPKGLIRISAPLYFGRHYLTPITTKFLKEFPDTQIDLILTNELSDPIKENIDIAIRGAGFIDDIQLKNSSLHAKKLIHEKIGLYASRGYLLEHGEPQTPAALSQHHAIGFAYQKQEIWEYRDKQRLEKVTVKTRLRCNDIGSSLQACSEGSGIGRYTELNARALVKQNQIQPILRLYDWGDYYLYAVYSHQKALPKRARLVLDYIDANL